QKLLIVAGALTLIAIIGVIIWAANRGGGETPAPIAVNTTVTPPKKSPGTTDTGGTPTPPEGNGGKEPPNDKDRTPGGTSGSGGTSPSPPVTVPPPPIPTEIDDDGQALYMSPTSGKRLEIRYVPKIPNVLAVFRPADILNQPEGEKAWT